MEVVPFADGGWVVIFGCSSSGGDLIDKWFVLILKGYGTVN